MFPNEEKVSYKDLLSMLLSRFLMKTFPTPDLRSDGSRCDHMIRMGRPFNASKFIVSSAFSAIKKKLIFLLVPVSVKLPILSSIIQAQLQTIEHCQITRIKASMVFLIHKMSLIFFF